MRTLRLTFAGMAILALTVGTTGVAVAQAEDTEDAAPAAVSEPPSPSIPTGHFVQVERSHLMLELHEGGTGISHNAIQGLSWPFTYAVDGDVFTWLETSAVALNKAASESEPPIQPTYRWDYDGERLAFELAGEDTSDTRKTLLTGNTLRLVEDPRVVRVAVRDLDVGSPLSNRTIPGFVASAEAGPDAYTTAEFAGRVAAVPIAKGQPITPDMLEPLPE